MDILSGNVGIHGSIIHYSYSIFSPCTGQTQTHITEGCGFAVFCDSCGIVDGIRSCIQFFFDIVIDDLDAPWVLSGVSKMFTDSRSKISAVIGSAICIFGINTFEIQ